MSLYRKYRPASFAEVIGQEHVTDPLGRAIDAGRIHHAFLFSGPRGCGKTSSARILARSLNCEQGPTSTPCGVCDSCVQLAPGGRGNLDVVELDAASHGGVDDTRDLRDRAFYAPVSSRYRVFIIDEAHMVSTAGFNALLKIVEEPPEHVIFIFATTEPEKVIPTIRSRTHHYPFRLLGPKAMAKLLAYVLESEAISIEKAVYPLLIRAGGGSPRDTLSLLDQLIAGSPDNTVSLEHAATFLGVTDTEFLDEIIIAIHHKQADIAFAAVEKILESGLDPRRFVLDLLERHRDLLLIQSIPDAVERGILQARSDTADTLRELARTIPGVELVHNAEVLVEGLSGLRGTTAPRLLLEIMIAKLLLAHTITALEGRLSSLESLVEVDIPSSPVIREKNLENKVVQSSVNDAHSAVTTHLLEVPGNEVPGNEEKDISSAMVEKIAHEDPAVAIKFFRKSLSAFGEADGGIVATINDTDVSSQLDEVEVLAENLDEKDYVAQEFQLNSLPATDEKPIESQSISTPRAYSSIRKPQEVRAQFSKNSRQQDHSQTRLSPAIEEDSVAGVQENSSDTVMEDSVVISAESNLSHTLTVELAYQAWPAIRKKIHELDKVIEVMLASSEVIRVESRENKPLIVLEHESAPLINRLNSERGTAVLRKAAEEIIGYPVDVISELKQKPQSSGGGSHPKVQTGVEPEKIQPRAKITSPEKKVKPEYFGYEDEIVETDQGEQNAVELLNRILGAREVD